MPNVFPLFYANSLKSIRCNFKDIHDPRNCPGCPGTRLLDEYPAVKRVPVCPPSRKYSGVPRDFFPTVDGYPFNTGTRRGAPLLFYLRGHETRTSNYSRKLPSAGLGLYAGRVCNKLPSGSGLVGRGWHFGHTI